MNIKEKQELILGGDIYKALLALAVPIMINNLIQTLYNLVDGLWISKIGSVEFAATAFVYPVNFLFVSIGMGLSIAGTSILSQLLGAGENDTANKYSSQLAALALVAGLIVTVVGVLISPYVVRAMGVDGDVLYFGALYLRLTFLDMPFMFYFFIFNAIMNAQGNTMLPTVLSGISAVINIILDPVLMFVFDMGVAGAAIATVISKALLAFAGLVCIVRGKSAIKPDFRGFRFDWGIIKNSLKIALPASIGQSGSAIGFIVLNSFIVSYGTATMAAYGMVNRITSLVGQPAAGIGTALVSITGQNMGAGNYRRTREGFRKAMILTAVIGSAGCAVMLIFRSGIINFFMQSKDDMEVINQSITYLIYISFSMPLMGIFSVFQGLFQGAGHTSYSMAMEIGRLWLVRLPMILFFKHLTAAGPAGIWFSMSFSNLIVCIYGYMIYRKGRWADNIMM